MFIILVERMINMNSQSPRQSPRYERFTFTVNHSERTLIAVLAEQLQRSQSDAVRFVVTAAAKEMQAQQDAKNSTGEPETSKAGLQ